MSFFDGFTPIQHVEQIRYAIDHEKNLIREQWSVRITADTLKEHWPKFLQNPDVMNCRRTVADISDAIVDVSGDEFFHLIHSIVNPRLKGLKWITAIVVSSDYQYGISRQYGAYANSFSEEQIFKSAEQAFDWISTKDHKT